MSDFGRINPQDLDRHITGNYGEDQIVHEPEPTQRPWQAVGREVRTDTPGQYVPYIVAQCGVYTLTCTDREGVPEANAKLIAGAVSLFDDLVFVLGDLLEKAEAVDEELTGPADRQHFPPALMAKARDVLAKALAVGGAEQA